MFEDYRSEGCVRRTGYNCFLEANDNVIGKNGKCKHLKPKKRDMPAAMAQLRLDLCHSESIAPFRVRRYARSGARYDIAPRIVSCESALINIHNLKAQYVDIKKERHCVGWFCRSKESDTAQLPVMLKAIFSLSGHYAMQLPGVTAVSSILRQCSHCPSRKRL